MGEVEFRTTLAYDLPVASQDFLYGFYTDLPEADFSLAYHAYEWPKKTVVILKDATDKANNEHREFEDALKRRRHAFAKQLQEYQEDISMFDTIGEKDMKAGADGKENNKDKFAQQTLDLSQKLKDAQVGAWPAPRHSADAHFDWFGRACIRAHRSQETPISTLSLVIEIFVVYLSLRR